MEKRLKLSKWKQVVKLGGYGKPLRENRSMDKNDCVRAQISYFKSGTDFKKCLLAQGVNDKKKTTKKQTKNK